MTHFTALRTIVSCTSRFTPLIQPQRLFSLSTPSHTNSDHKRHPIFSPSANVDSKPSFGSDPYPIPLQSPLHHTRVPEKYTITESAQAEPVKLDEPIETLRARLVYQSRKRGIVEMELLLSTFIDGGKLEGWDLDQLRTYDRVRSSCLLVLCYHLPRN